MEFGVVEWRVVMICGVSLLFYFPASDLFVVSWGGSRIER